MYEYGIIKDIREDIYRWHTYTRKEMKLYFFKKFTWCDVYWKNTRKL